MTGAEVVAISSICGITAVKCLVKKEQGAEFFTSLALAPLLLGISSFSSPEAGSTLRVGWRLIGATGCVVGAFPMIRHHLVANFGQRRIVGTSARVAIRPEIQMAVGAVMTGAAVVVGLFVR